MQLQNPVEPIAAAIHQACLRDSLPLKVAEVKWEPRKDRPGMDRIETGKFLDRRPEIYHMEVFAMFAQTWASTALGFGGLGGAAMTPAYTIIVIGPRHDFCVYFGGRFAYRVEKANEAFFEDVKDRCMCKVAESESRYGAKSLDENAA